MAEAKQQQVIKSPFLPPNCHAKYEDKWEIVKGDDGIYISSSQDNSSIISNESTSSTSDMADDASSPTSSSSSSSESNSPLFELADLMANLPIKRGLSKFYNGKSQSFTSLLNVSCTEDLVKKEVPYRRKLKASRSYGNGFVDVHKPYTLPKAIISKKISRGSVTYLSFPSRRGSLLNSTRPPLVPVQKKF